MKFTIISDGGSIRNGEPDAIGYGSYVFASETGQTTKQKSLSFPAGTTSNEAEYMTLITALREIKEAFTNIGHDPKDIELTVKVDSQLIIGQLMKGWKIKAINLKPLVVEAGWLVDSFGKVVFEQITGQEMKAILGH
jgi:ribonuclease HI